MTAAEYIKELRIPSETAAILSELPLPGNHMALRELFFRSSSEFHETVSSDLSGLQILRLYLDWLTETEAMYASRNIPDSVFWDSMQDIPIWCEDHLSRLGEPGFTEWNWVGKSLRLAVIRLGRLQFEPGFLRKELTLCGKSYPVGTPILHVHIPAGKPLDLQAVQESMAQAPGFFRAHFGHDAVLFHCHSWLLSPDLIGLIPDTSRIMQFQQLFEVYATDDERQAEERVFGFLSDDPAVYPERTSLQRTVKKHLLDGKTILMAAGVRPIV